MINYIPMIEELSLNAWPAYKTQLYDGWLIRYSDFYTHRTNSVSIVGSSTIPLINKIRYCEQEYNRMNTPTIFKINASYDMHFDLLLSKQGYEIEHKTETYYMELEDLNPFNQTLHEVTLTPYISEDWIFELFRLNGTNNPSHLEKVPQMYASIPRETITAAIKKDGKTVATGLGIIERGYIGIYAIYVSPDYRNQQMAKTVCSALLIEAKNRGLKHAYLQVVSDNYIAQRVYHSLGFNPLYTYWFRVKR